MKQHTLPLRLPAVERERPSRPPSALPVCAGCGEPVGRNQVSVWRASGTWHVGCIEEVKEKTG